MDLKVELRPPKEVVILGADERSPDNIAWCAATYGINRLFWIDGYLICTEVYEKSFEHEIEEGVFCISQICYAKFPEYRKVFEVEPGTRIPIVDVSDMKIYRMIQEKIEEKED